jgi:hypothetical protein
MLVKNSLYKRIGIIALSLIVVLSGLFGYLKATSITIEAKPSLVSVDVSVNQPVVKVPDWLQNPQFVNPSAPKDEKDGTVSITVSNEKIEIGKKGTDSKTDFKQSVKFNKWNGENWLSLTLDDSNFDLGKDKPKDSKIEGTSVKSSSKDYAIEYKATGIVEGFNELGGLDVIITLNSKPLKNTLTFTYDSNGLTPYLQPKLTAEEIAEGCVRPEHVVNSIAFYADGKSNHLIGGVNYGTGKVGHLYRMKAIDKKGEWAWFDWSIGGNNQLIGTIDPKALAEFTYPVRIEPMGDTFGYVSLGASSSNAYAYNTQIRSDKISSAGAVGTGVSITIGAKKGGSASNVKCAIYDTADPCNYLTDSGTPAISISSTTKGWFTGTYSTGPTIAAINYWLVFIGDSGWYNNGQVAYDTTANATYFIYGQTYGTWPATITSWSYAGLDKVKYSIYCTYTAGGAISISNSPSSKDFGVVAANTTYQAGGGAYSNPVTDGQCTFTITNNAASAVKLNIKASDFTGGGGWTLGAPDGTHARLTAVVSGVDPASGVVLTTSDQQLIASLAGSGTKKWDLQLETATSFADGTQKQSICTLTGVAP